MSLDSRNRMICFRVTSEEYERLRELGFSLGVGNMSQMARAAINMLLENPSRTTESSLAARIAELEGRLNILSLEIKRFASHAHPQPD